MRKINTSKLAIRQETLRSLTGVQLRAVNGGEPIPSGVADDTCFCPSAGVTACPACFSHRPGIC